MYPQRVTHPEPTCSYRATVEPISWHVARWSADPYSRGGWSHIRPGGSPADRWTLAEPIDERLFLCGEAIGTDQAAMTHGAYASGCRAANACAAVAEPGERILVVGAGMAGLGAASTLRVAGIENIVLEARDRIGGRTHTVALPGREGEPPVFADAGAAWLQQFRKNPFADLAVALGAGLVGTDFHSPLSAAADGPVDDSAVAAALAGLAASAQRLTAELADPPAGGVDGRADATLADAHALWTTTASPAERRAMQFAIDADVVLESGAALHDTSARWFFAEDGVGHDDHWITSGYQCIVEHLAVGLAIRLSSPVTRIQWRAADDSRGHGVAVTLATGEVVHADRCIASLPISLLHAGRPALSPGLPPALAAALAGIGMGRVDKVLLRFAERWWPVPPRGYFRWYDSPASWCEWADLTDGCGAPVVAGLLADEAVTRHHDGRSDTQIVRAATAALGRWAVAARRA